jgi:hypothetical protein
MPIDLSTGAKEILLEMKVRDEYRRRFMPAFVFFVALELAQLALIAFLLWKLINRGTS